MMKIIQSSIQDISCNFSNFEQSICGLNYTVWITAKRFMFTEESQYTFSLNDLKELFPSEKENINGFIEIIPWKDINENIETILQYSGDEQGQDFSNEMLNLQTTEHLDTRKKLFWNLIKKYIALPPDKSFVLKSHEQNLFNDYMIWDFCYILLKDSCGLVLCAGASD